MRIVCAIHPIITGIKLKIFKWIGYVLIARKENNTTSFIVLTDESLRSPTRRTVHRWDENLRTVFKKCMLCRNWTGVS